MEKQWEVGKTYKLVDVRAFREDDDSTSSNRVEIVVTRPEQKLPDVPTTNIIEQWLDKYQQVASADYTIGKIDTSDYGVCLTTDYGDILGSKQVVEFINNRYSQLKSAENQSKLKELQAKKDKLMLELASVDGEINELGGVV